MGGSAKVPQGYQETGQAAADTSYQSLTSQLSPYVTSALSNIPTAQGLTNNIVNNPYGTGYQNAANTAAGTYGAAGTAANSGASMMQQLADQAAKGAQGTNLSWGTDSSIYGTEYQKMLDQTNAMNSMYGVGTSPYGAGLANEAGINFNVDWINNELQRAQTAAGTFGALEGDALSGYQGAQGLWGQGAQDQLTAGQLPYQTANAISGAGLGAEADMSALYSAFMQPGENQLSNLSNYLSLGQNATKNAQNAVIADNQANSSFWGGIGSIFGDLGSAFLKANPL